MKRYDQLTTTRFWAVLLVLIYHGAGGIYFSHLNRFPFSPILLSAPTAVSYMYVLSGFVMSLAYFRPGEKLEAGKYWMARILRIYPLYIIAFLLTCYYYLDGLAGIKPQKILVNIFVLQSWFPQYAQSFNYPSWALTVEFFFYAIFPFLLFGAYRLSVRKALWIGVIAWIVNQIVSFIFWGGYLPSKQLFLVYNPIFHLSSFVIGMAGGIWFVQVGRGQKVDQRINLLILFSSLILISGYLILSEVYPQLPHDLQLLTGLLAPLFVIFISTLALDKTWLSKMLSQRWLVVLGEASFALYILHIPLIWLYERALENFGWGDPVYIKSITCLPLMILIAVIVHHYIEPPVHNWMKNIFKRVSLRLLILDLVILTASIFLSFRFRFGSGREYLAYREMGLQIFWCAFFLRTIASYLFDVLNPASLHWPILKMARQLLFSSLAGSGVVFLIIFIEYRAGWYINFPRSVFVVDLLIVFLLSFLLRCLLRAFQFSKPVVLPAS